MERQDEVWKNDALVKTYLEGVRGGIPLAGKQIEVMLRLLKAGGGPVRRFADIGCGDGVLSAAILAQYPEAHGVLVDFSEPMLRQARERFGGHGFRLEFVMADYGVTQWRRGLPGPFDAVVSGYSIHHQPDARKRQLYAEIFELLGPGGLFVNVEHVAPATGWVESVFDELFIDSLYAFARNKGSDESRDDIARSFFDRPDKEANILAPVELQCQWLRECGFEDVDCFFKIFELAVFGGRRPK
ncbi:MAG: class I SAM-dependent methyltransferase [Desulfobacteraceae bacterium]|nr:class I SAM-dependent methyltransferase [Desulfobacteraceae bacterium]